MSNDKIAVPLSVYKKPISSNFVQILKEHRKSELLPVRAMIVGIPNVGKSSIINMLRGKQTTKVENRPGVTRNVQWVYSNFGIQLLDTPGILNPNLENQEVAWKLACIGSISTDLFDTVEVSCKLCEFLKKKYPELLLNRYKLENLPESGFNVLEMMAIKRKFIKKNSELDIERTSKMIINEFQSGKIGKISLEIP